MPNDTPATTVYTDSDLTRRLKYYRLTGTEIFREIAPQLNAMQPGRERSAEEFDQICLAIGLAVKWLLDAPEP